MNFKENEDIMNLCRALSGLQSPEQVASFLEDLCTIQEISAMSQRLQVAGLLSGGMNYAEVTQKTGVSSATISRINRCLNYGSGGYKLALGVLEGK